MKVIGLTGSFGTGKTFAASVFRSLGARVLDADRIAHAAMKKGAPVYKEIVATFGAGILNKDKSINRKKLADVVFRNRKDRKRLDCIVHPEVIKTMRDMMRREGRDVILVIDAPLLVEANLLGMVDTLVVVKSSLAKQIERCMKKFGIKKEEVIRRIDSQIPIRKKIELADFVVDNRGTKSETRRQIKKIWRALWN